MAPEKRSLCPDCDSGTNRRDFMRTLGGVAVATGTVGYWSGTTLAAPSPKSAAETATKQLYDTLNDKQRKLMVLSWDDPRRTKVSANWDITKAYVGSFEPKQQEIIKQIVKGATSEDGYERFLKQMDDDGGGIDKYAIAIFGEPGSDQFEFELTGRHLTLRADGNTIEKVAFGGPIVYGHGEAGNSKGNLFWYQSKRANELFGALDEKQRQQALLDMSPKESAVELREKASAIPGLAGSELSSDQQELLRNVLGDILSPYRKEDVDEALACLKSGGGLEQTRISYYKNGDIGDDGFWDVWRVESPTVVCHFRGKPHVHAYINIAQR